SQYIAFLEEMGIHLQAVDGQLKVTPAKLVGPGTIEVLKRYKAELLAAISGPSTASTSTDSHESRETSESVDAHKPVCRRCGSDQYLDIPIHGGRSLRRDCAKCRRFQCFPLWYGKSNS